MYINTFLARKCYLEILNCKKLFCFSMVQRKAIMEIALNEYVHINTF